MGSRLRPSLSRRKRARISSSPLDASRRVRIGEESARTFRRVSWRGLTDIYISATSRPIATAPCAESETRYRERLSTLSLERREQRFPPDARLEKVSPESLGTRFVSLTRQARVFLMEKHTRFERSARCRRNPKAFRREQKRQSARPNSLSLSLSLAKKPQSGVRSMDVFDLFLKSVNLFECRSTTSATARTCLGPTSAPAGRSIGVGIDLGFEVEV